MRTPKSQTLGKSSDIRRTWESALKAINRYRVGIVADRDQQLEFLEILIDGDPAIYGHLSATTVAMNRMSDGWTAIEAWEIARLNSVFYGDRRCSREILWALIQYELSRMHWSQVGKGIGCVRHRMFWQDGPDKRPGIFVIYQQLGDPELPDDYVVQ